MDDFDKYFKTPSQDEIDREWLVQLCYDGQMADDEISEFVETIINWKNKALEKKYKQ